ncbi:asparagine synthase-related protein [Silvibacterium acidisoli]|uniref:asparagine synthase-related protein n=1 Tax=Acidobacteriaceae bacterium ZG23-2 TaxID=2883246 RepID=UPI00406C0E81
MPALFSARTLEKPEREYLLPGADASTKAREERLENAIEPGRYRAVVSGIGGDELLGGPINPLPELADLLVLGKLHRFLKQSVAWCLTERAPILHLVPEVVGFSLKRYSGWNGTSDSDPRWYTQNLLRAFPQQRNRMRRDRIGLLPSCLEGEMMWTSLLETQPHRFPAITVRYEYRYPLLDRELVEFVLRVPPEQIRSPENRRSLMRRAMGAILPTEILERRKKAFPAQANSRLLAEHRVEIESLFRGSRLASLGYIDERKFLSAFSSSNFHQSPVLMRMIGLELWLRNDLVTT